MYEKATTLVQKLSLRKGDMLVVNLRRGLEPYSAIAMKQLSHALPPGAHALVMERGAALSVIKRPNVRKPRKRARPIRRPERREPVKPTPEQMCRWLVSRLKSEGVYEVKIQPPPGANPELYIWFSAYVRRAEVNRNQFVVAVPVFKITFYDTGIDIAERLAEMLTFQINNYIQKYRQA